MAEEADSADQQQPAEQAEPAPEPAEQPEPAPGPAEQPEPAPEPAEQPKPATEGAKVPAALRKAPAEEAPAVPERSAPSAPPEKHYFWGTGRRKKAVARVRIRPGTGRILLNKRELDVYFPQDKDRNAVLAPLQCVRMMKAWDIWANIKGGGFTGQAGAVKLGLARALAIAMPDTEQALRAQGLLTRDARMVERKKPGQKGARKRFQFSKR